jgi:hypothetical protein
VNSVASVFFTVIVILCPACHIVFWGNFALKIKIYRIITFFECLEFVVVQIQELGDLPPKGYLPDIELAQVFTTKGFVETCKQLFTNIKRRCSLGAGIDVNY